MFKVEFKSINLRKQHTVLETIGLLTHGFSFPCPLEE